MMISVYVDDFLALSGRKVICGSTTADIFSKITDRSVTALPVSNSFSSPPKYEIEGVDLVTEGAATLSQAYNILDVDIKEYKELNAVTELCLLLKEADTVNFLVGGAKNTGNTGIAFKTTWHFAEGNDNRTACGKASPKRRSNRNGKLLISLLLKNMIRFDYSLIILKNLFEYH